MSSLYKKTKGIISEEQITNMGMKEISESSYDKLYNNINNFAVENNTFILYITNSSNDFFIFENDLKKLITESGLANSFVYLDAENIDITRLISDLSQNKMKINKKDIPVFVYFKNGYINEIIHHQNFDINKVKNKLIELGVI